ncbi:hypothetical protein B0H13DRAFT_2331314 [Mycena leptocephala]|nr:hypothetical protein B0H13DRAFT_2331314 [Mycena leptocephala]
MTNLSAKQKRKKRREEQLLEEKQQVEEQKTRLPVSTPHPLPMSAAPVSTPSPPSHPHPHAASASVGYHDSYDMPIYGVHVTHSATDIWAFIYGPVSRSPSPPPSWYVPRDVAPRNHSVHGIHASHPSTPPRDSSWYHEDDVMDIQTIHTVYTAPLAATPRDFSASAAPPPLTHGVTYNSQA